MSFRIRISSILFLLAVLLCFDSPLQGVLAHGGGTPRLTNEDIGPYWISVWTSPQPVREGQLHVTVAVAEPGQSGEQQAGAPVLGADVAITLIPRSGGLADVRAMATNEQSANKLFYEADLLVPVAGDWQVQVDVRGPDGSGQAQFDLPVEPARESNWFLFGGIGLLAVAGFFVYYATRRR